MTLLKSFIISFALTFVVCMSGILWYRSTPIFANTENSASWWSIQSIDTMKYSRDLSREKKTSTSFDETIDTQILNIKKAGATYVAIATPYDEEFVPMLTRWVRSARTHDLRVWFRGNFSGWEGWFDYPRISRADHQKLLTAFITKHPDLFEEGDIFTPCPECENGGPGDPRQTGDVDGYRLFLINEYDAATSAFRKIGIGVTVGYFSMNYDVANMIMDKATTEALGGIVTIDHYVKTPEQLVSDIRAIAKRSGGNVFIGEFGAPIPDIHGDMNTREQYTWIREALTLMAKEPTLVGVNYWVNVGGSTQLWSDDGTPNEAVKAVTNGFTPPAISGKVVDQFNKPITNANIQTYYKSISTGTSGQYTLPYISDSESVTIKKDNYADTTIRISDIKQNNTIIIKKLNLSWFESLISYINNLISNNP